MTVSFLTASWSCAASVANAFAQTRSRRNASVRRIIREIVNEGVGRPASGVSKLSMAEREHHQECESQGQDDVPRERLTASRDLDGAKLLELPERLSDCRRFCRGMRRVHRIPLREHCSAARAGGGRRLFEMALRA